VPSRCIDGNTLSGVDRSQLFGPMLRESRQRKLAQPLGKANSSAFCSGHEVDWVGRVTRQETHG